MADGSESSSSNSFDLTYVPPMFVDASVKSHLLALQLALSLGQPRIQNVCSLVDTLYHKQLAEYMSYEMAIHNATPLLVSLPDLPGRPL